MSDFLSALIEAEERIEDANAKWGRLSMEIDHWKEVAKWSQHALETARSKEAIVQAVNEMSAEDVAFVLKRIVTNENPG